MRPDGLTMGFTGTANGMKPNQKLEIDVKLAYWYQHGYRIFRHGGCIGADDQAAHIAKKLGYYVIEHSGYSNPNEIPARTNARCDCNDETLTAKPMLVRDKDIVKESDRMLATPKGRVEERRSGTWTTVRYARTAGKPIEICYPVTL